MSCAGPSLFRGGEMMSVGWRLVNGRKTWVTRYLGAATEEAYDRAMKAADRLPEIGEAAEVRGGRAGRGHRSSDQYGDDADRKDLSTTDKVGRVAAAGAYKGGRPLEAVCSVPGRGSHGASIGSVIPVAGTVVGAVVGAVIGGVPLEAVSGDVSPTRPNARF